MIKKNLNPRFIKINKNFLIMPKKIELRKIFHCIIQYY